MTAQEQPGNTAWEQVFQIASNLHGAGRAEEAASLFAAILEHHPIHLPSMQRLAAIRRQQGRFEESLALIEKAVAAWPESAECHNSLGNALNFFDRVDEAVEHYRAAARLRAPFPEALVNLGNSLRRLSRLEEAAEAYRAAIEARPGYAEAHGGRGLCLSRLNRPAEALEDFLAAVAIDPRIAAGNRNVAITLADLNRHEESLPYFERARQLEPDSAEGIFNEGLVRLALGDFPRGLPMYEARWQIAANRQPREFPQPRWDGQSDLAGKAILLDTEQGIGDSLLFARYIPMIAALGARVIVESPAALVPLMRSISGVGAVVGPGETLPPFDVQCPLGSLPLALGTTVDTIPRRTPYVFAPQSTGVASLGSGRRRIGLCWAGNPGHQNDHNRSIPLSLFEPLLQMGDIDFVCLQQNLRPGDEAILGRYSNIDRSIQGVRNLGETAALIDQLDLVITLDTAVAHLAGAIHRPVWILIGFRPYWVWLLEGSDSPWYPSARLFRQPAFADWKSVIDTVAAELARLTP